MCHTEETSLVVLPTRVVLGKQEPEKGPRQTCASSSVCVLSSVLSTIAFSRRTHADMAQQHRTCAQGEQKINFTNCSCLFINADNWRGQGGRELVFGSGSKCLLIGCLSVILNVTGSDLAVLAPHGDGHPASLCSDGLCLGSRSVNAVIWLK